MGIEFKDKWFLSTLKINQKGTWANPGIKIWDKVEHIVLKFIHDYICVKFFSKERKNTITIK